MARMVDLQWNCETSQAAGLVVFGAALSFDCLPLPVARPRLAIIAACSSLLRIREVVNFLSMLREVNSYDFLLMSRQWFRGSGRIPISIES